MATFPADPATHPLAKYLEAHNAARQALVAEMFRQQALSEDMSLSVAERETARAEMLRLQAAIAQLDASQQTFLVGLATGILPPSQALVDETVVLSAKLGQVIVDANRPALMLRLVTQFLDGAGAVATGKVTAAAPASA